MRQEHERNPFVMLLAFGTLAIIAALCFGVIASGSSKGACALGSCPRIIKVADSGKQFNYSVTTQFSVVLHENENPRDELACIPGGVVLEESANAVSDTEYQANLVASAPGTCTLSSKKFNIVISVK